MEIKKTTAVVVGMAMLGLVAAVAFLLGRESNRSAAEAPPVATVAPVAVPAAVPLAPTPPPVVPVVPAETPAAKPADVRQKPEAPQAHAAAPSTPGATPAAPASEAAAVKQYFVEVAAIQASGPAGDANEFANHLLTAAMAGDSSGFGSLIHTAEAGMAKARALRVPAACQDYHRKMLGLLGESATMLRTLRSAIQGQDSEALAGIATSATELQSRTEALQADEKALKARFAIDD